MIVYDIKKGFQISKKFAQPAGEIMAELEAEDKLTAEELVNVSRPEDAPLHDYFEWNDAIAAEKYRVRQGNYLIEAVVEVHNKPSADDSNKVEVEVIKPFYALETGSKNYYHIETIVQSEDKAQKLLAMATKELLSIRKRYDIIADKLSGVFKAIDELQESA